jgi:hypothetical protein
MVYIMNGGQISPPWESYYQTIRQGYESAGFDMKFLREAAKLAQKGGDLHD